MPQVIAEAFEQGALLAAGFGKLDDGLEQALEQLVPAPAVLVQELINLVDVARAPEVHEPVDAVNERHGLAGGSFVTE
jgi:hypothetical protein